MSWRSKRGGDKAERTLAAATVARITGEEGSAEEGVAAVRAVLARVELERTVESVVIVDLDDGPLAEQLAAALGDDSRVTVARLGDVKPADVDAVFAVAHASQPAREVVDALKPLDAILLGVVLSGDPAVETAAAPEAEPSTFDAELERHVEAPAEPHAAAEPVESADAALEALAELERAAGSVTLPPAPAPPEPKPEPEPEPEPEFEPVPVDAELSARLTELTHREVALRKVTEAVEKLRSRLEEKEQELEARDRATAVDDVRLTEALARAEQAERRVLELEQRVIELAQRLEPQPVVASAAAVPTPAPAEPPAAVDHHAEPDDGTYNLHHLEQVVRDAQLREDPEAEEWAYYLPLLREHADSTGRLPAQFHSLIDSVFGV